jgi:hypothetical protein
LTLLQNEFVVKILDRSLFLARIAFGYLVMFQQRETVEWDVLQRSRLQIGFGFSSFSSKLFGIHSPFSFPLKKITLTGIGGLIFINSV